MGTQDSSRSIFDPNKRYKSVRQQQGRVLLDDDWNENNCIAEEERRRQCEETVGVVGSADQGFRVEAPHIDANEHIDFTLRQGSLYLGGHRLSLSEDTSFQRQPDHLQLMGSSFPAKPTAARRDMAVVVATSQSVCSVEDRELLEIALGGPDTTTRQRLEQQILLVEGLQAEDCDQAWQEAVTRFEQAGWGTLSDKHEWTSDARLKVSFVGGAGGGGDLCAPQPLSGFQGAENQSIRVQLIDAQHLTWGYDNGAAFYRVKLDPDRQGMTMLTLPPDQASWPKHDQVVEILPWSSVLPNGEKIAGASGHLARVSTSYDPQTQTLRLDSAVPTAGFEDWMNRSDQASIQGDGEVYVFMRVWDRGADLSELPAIPFTVGQALALGQTGLQVTLTGTQFRKGDSWQMALRPESPQSVQPWALTSVGGQAPQGPRCWMAPLALIRWPGDANPAQVEDCRPRFRPLTRQNGCVRYTVGDGVQSFGDYNDLSAAVAALPSTGGHVHVLPGVHKTNVAIDGRRDIQISGCGRRSRILPDDPSEPILSLVDVTSIEIAKLGLIAPEGEAIVAAVGVTDTLASLYIHDNSIIAEKSAISVAGGSKIEIVQNTIRVVDKSDAGAGITVLSADVNIVDNDVAVIPGAQVPIHVLPVPEGGAPPDPSDPNLDLSLLYDDRAALRAYSSFVWEASLAPSQSPTPFRAFGGINILSGSAQVELRGNHICGGRGPGIQLGSPLLPGSGSYTPPTPPILAAPAGQLLGKVTNTQGDPVPNLPIVLRHRTESDVYQVISDSQGAWVIAAVKVGQYDVTLGSLPYRIVQVQVPQSGASDPRVTVQVTSTANAVQTVPPSLRAILGVRIYDNDIVAMGRSGIGIPQSTAAALASALSQTPLSGSAAKIEQTLGAFGLANGFAYDVSIVDNRIHDCLYAASEPSAAAALPQARGVGGISLGLCDNLLIQNNRIESNGVGLDAAVYGIFVVHARGATLLDNQIRSNGPTSLASAPARPPGGICLYLVEAPYQRSLSAAGAGSLPHFETALRVHRNVVEQPMGRAFSATVLGTAQVSENQFHTHRALAAMPQPIAGQSDGRVPTTPGLSSYGGLAPIAELAGVVFLCELGAMQVQQPYQKVAAAAPGATSGASSDAFPSIAQVASPPLSLPIARLLFHNNQIGLDYGDDAPSAVTLMSFGELSVHHNQSVVLDCDALGANLLCLGHHVSACHNQTQEPQGLPDARLSVVSFAQLLGDASHNIGYHCSTCISRIQAVETNNLALLSSPSDCGTALATLKTQTATTHQQVYQGVMPS